MFDYKMAYTNSKGDRIPFNAGSYGLHLDESDLFDYFWTVSAAQGRITSIVREPHEIPVGILYLCDRIDAINEFDDCIDYDARVEKPGTLRLNGYSLTGVFCKSSPDDYQWKKGYMRRDMTFFTADRGWRRTVTYQFRKQSEISGSGLDFPHDYEFDYSIATNQRTIDNTDAAPSDFVIRIYGPCVNPYMIIAGNIYQVNVVLLSGEQLIIDSTDKSQIIKKGQFGAETNVYEHAVFSAPGEGSYIFELIPPGVSNVVLPGSFAADLEIIHCRSTPRWYEHDKDTIIIPMG